MTKELTGRHVLLIVILAFGTIIAANLTMLFAATGTFPGLVVGNSYVASQGWDARAEAQRALGWSAEIRREEGGIRIELADRDGNPVTPDALNVSVGRPTMAGLDQTFVATADGGAYFVPVELAAGRWLVEVTVGDPETRFTAKTDLVVRGAN